MALRYISKLTSQQHASECIYSFVMSISIKQLECTNIPKEYLSLFVPTISDPYMAPLYKLELQATQILFLKENFLSLSELIISGALCLLFDHKGNVLTEVFASTRFHCKQHYQIHLSGISLTDDKG